jgi:hypothetical protein
MELRDPLRAIVPTEPRRLGTARTYGHQRRLCTLLGLVFLAAFVRQVVHLTTEPLPPNHGPIALLAALMVLLAAIPIGTLIMSRRLGIHVSDTGIENVAVDTKASAPWDDIREFVAAPAAIPGTAAVNIVHPDGRMTPLSRLGDWPARAQSYCDALNQELAFMRSRR